MTFRPMELIIDRVNRYGADSDSALFTELLYAGEFVLKITTATLVSAIEDDRENHRYRLLHDLVRADGLGDWARALDEALTGPASQHIAGTLFDVRKAFTERLGKGSWQQEAVHDLHEVLVGVQDGAQPIGEKVALRTWFQMFAELRNRTRGHGALTPATCAKLASKLNDSIRLICANSPVFQLPWAYLHRNLSGKYKVVNLGGNPAPFEKLTSTASIRGENYVDGVYFWAGGYRRAELIHTNVDVSDFFLPNGAFRNGNYKIHSLITDNEDKVDAAPYMAAASERPASETQGMGDLEVLGKVFTNLPSATLGYVRRPQLESEVREALMNDRHPIVTLVGRGGIGKTSVALMVLREIAETNRYQVIIWFSARDIDLMMSGAKLVQPHLLTDREIAKEYRALLDEPTVDQKGKKLNPIDFMAGHLRKSPYGPTLYVFDNFETVRNPVDLFQWIDMNIRLPNKVAITTRFRDFKADYPINVSGMEQKEAEALVAQTAVSLDIERLLSTKERSAIIEQAGGHPYVIKIVLGEIANARSFSKPSKLIARKGELLDALFERTYANLSPMAVRIFLTLSMWRSLVPQLAVEAVLLRHGDENVDPELGIDELVRMSLVERTTAGDGTDFLEVPLTAALFSRRKLEVSPDRTVIEEDNRFLQDVGPTAASSLKGGIRPRIVSFFRKSAKRIGEGREDLEQMRPVLEFLARGYAPAWLLLSELEEENSSGSDINRTAEYVRRYLETEPPSDQARAAWQRLVGLYRRVGDVIGACSAFSKAAEITEPPLDQVSTMANWLNNSSEVKDSMDVAERRALFNPLARLMEARLEDASATDLSRLAWLHLHCDEEGRALDVANLGHKRDPENIHCQRLVAKLTGAC